MRYSPAIRFTLYCCASLAIAFGLAACSTYQDDSPPGGAQSGGTGGSSSQPHGGSAVVLPVAGAGGTATGGAPATGASGSISNGGTTSPAQLVPLPLIVDQFFGPSGYMADAQNGNATMTPLTEMGDTTCNGDRASAEARGVCRIVTFSTFGASPTLTWGGVYWQYPDKNWGEKPGLRVEAGATKIVFKARGEKGGEKVGFFAGGLGLDGMTHLPTATNYDGFYVSGDDNAKTLTTEWTAYEIDLTGKSYDKGVLGAFGWGVGLAGNTLPVKFYIDDIAWEK